MVALIVPACLFLHEFLKPLLAVVIVLFYMVWHVGMLVQCSQVFILEE